jgi:hypothetical protein
MRATLLALAIPVLFVEGCRQQYSQRIVLRISQVKPDLFDEHTEGVLYTDPSYLPDPNVPDGPGPDAVPLKQGSVNLDDVLYPGGRAFEKWEYLTVEIDGRQSYTPRPQDSIDVGTIRKPPSKITVSGPIKKPLYYVLQTSPGIDEPNYWILAKGVFEVGDPALNLLVDHEKLKKPKSRLGTPH